ncbi:hypothetical protein [Synechocystis sp. PCC 7509]|uniref:hypothetical protein n=1 Tax=Synechocystis sp. PCC 7509 TaxID=927677 RepID=UPI0002AC6ABF|nr:hypothetical protein [Synechocystis sp. PCC 7509]
MKIDELNRIYLSRKYQLEFRVDKQGNYLRLLNTAQNEQIKKFTFPDPTADLPVDLLEYVKTLPDGDLST